MLILWGSLIGLFVYLELIYHISSFGMWTGNPIYPLILIGAWSAAEAMAVGVLKGRGKKICFYLCIWAAIVWTGAQKIYLYIFKQPLLWEAVFQGGQDALTNYWREALEGVYHVLPFLLLMILPGVVMTVLIQKGKWKLADFDRQCVIRMALVLGAGVAGSVATLAIGKKVQAEDYEAFYEYFDPLTIAEDMGVLPLLQRDTIYTTEKAADKAMQKLSNSKQDKQQRREQLAMAAGGKILQGDATGNKDGDSAAEASQGDVTGNKDGDSASETSQGDATGNKDGDSASETSQGDATGNKDGEGDSTGKANAGGTSSEKESGDEKTPEQEQISDKPKKEWNQLEIDWEILHALAENKHQTWLSEYVEGQKPTNTNTYTGLFEGYNLIYLTAEGFSPYAVREELTPTLYRLIHTGFVFDNYYVPLWQTSTSDGEYINCTGLIPDGQFSMRKSADNNMAFTLPRFFEKEGAKCLAYHNNSLSYYDRYLTHNNLGYLFKGCALGKLSAAEWGDSVFTMENPKAWPASDLDMMQATVGDYIGEEQFHVYYMTVSGHMNYNFRGNAMSAKNREAVAGLDLSENARAYIACNIELDKALEYLLGELEQAGILEKTVICMSADHYPYAMTEEQYLELSGKDLSSGMDLYRNNLVLWNAGMEQEPVHISKACGSMDLVPTLLNLFGFDYDSRMYAGRDIFSDAEGLVIFNDRSFVSDSCIYRRKGREIIWLTDEEGNYIVPEEEQKKYLEDITEEVKNRYQFSAYVLQEDYYADVKAALTGQEGVGSDMGD